MWKAFKVSPFPILAPSRCNSIDEIMIEAKGLKIKEEYDTVVDRLKKHALKLRKQLEESRTTAAEASKASKELVKTLAENFEKMSQKQEDYFNGIVKREQEISAHAAKLAFDTSNFLLNNQRLKFESAAVVASKTHGIMMKALSVESEATIQRLTQEVESIAAIQRFAYDISSQSANESADLVVASQQQKYESKICEATIQANLKLAAEKRSSSIAIAAKSKNDSQIQSERAVAEIGLKLAERANAVLLANQELKYETQAKAARESFKSSMDLLQEDSQSKIDAFNAEIVAKDLKYVVAKLTAERLEQQIMTDRLQRSTETAQQETELMLSICGNVTHDLKSPLHTLIMGIETLRSAPGLDCSFTSELLSTLDSACAFMNSAINCTIDFTKVSSGIGLTPTNTSFNLQDSLQNPFKWVKIMLPLDDMITLELAELPEDLSSMIVSDKDWIEENLLCLLSNAVKFSSKGNVRAFVTLRGDMVRVTVEDRGIGIDAETRSNLFGQQSQSQRKSVGGSGLGLYSLSKRCAAIGGLCGVDDRNDCQHGSSFWFETPYVPGEQDILYSRSCDSNMPGTLTLKEGVHENSQRSFKRKASRDGDRPSQISPRLDSISNLSGFSFGSSNGYKRSSEVEIPPALSILIVDDSIAVVKILGQKLKSSGHKVVTAKNGAEGLEKMIAMTDELDLVIMDLQMPVMDGIEATSKYREWESKRFKRSCLELIPTQKEDCHMPIICSSANCNGENEIRAVAAGIDSFLPKPFNMAALTAALKEVLMVSRSSISNGNSVSSTAEDTKENSIRIEEEDKGDKEESIRSVSYSKEISGPTPILSI